MCVLFGSVDLTDANVKGPSGIGGCISFRVHVRWAMSLQQRRELCCYMLKNK